MSRCKTAYKQYQKQYDLNSQRWARQTLPKQTVHNAGCTETDCQCRLYRNRLSTMQLYRNRLSTMQTTETDCPQCRLYRNTVSTTTNRSSQLQQIPTNNPVLLKMSSLGTAGGTYREGTAQQRYQQWELPALQVTLPCRVKWAQ
jgi:hypothetical protein